MRLAGAERDRVVEHLPADAWDEVRRRLMPTWVGGWCEPLLVGFRGSLSHGTVLPETGLDDVDVMAVHVAPREHYVGLGRSELETVRHEPTEDDPWDVVSYELRHYVRLCLKQNPNVLQLLWLPDELVIHEHTWIGARLREARHELLSRRVLKAVRGYARDEWRRIEGTAGQGYMGAKRKALAEERGYDTKAAAHVVRLLLTGIEVAKTCRMSLPRPDADMIRAVKRGDWTPAELTERVARLEGELDRAEERTQLREDVDREEMEDLLMGMVQASML